MTNLKGSKTDQEWEQLQKKTMLNKKMKYWEEGQSRDMPTIKDPTILLGSDNDWGNIISVQKTENGFMFMEECDCVHYKEFTKSQALELIEELKQWIEKQ